MKIYISGIGGVAMGPLAFIARDLGYDVVGSDLTDQANHVDYMREQGFVVHIGQDGSAIETENDSSTIDWFVHTSALPDDNPELVYVQQADIKTSKRDEFINEFLNKHNLNMIAIAGTHGKTNTTAMVAWCLQQAGIPNSYSIGASLPFGPFGKYDEGSRYFVYEADEFDRNFLQYSPGISIVTNIAFDHPDTYTDQVEYDLAFAQFINQSESVYLYNDAFSSDLDKVHSFEKDDAESSTNIPGLYIRQNARLVIEMLVREFELPRQDVIDYLNNFPGTSRRMENISDGIYSDYAHHPDEIRATIETGKEMSDRVVVVYQPHQNIRQHEILDAYGDCFEGADKVYWLPTYLSREDDSLDVLSPQELVDATSDPSFMETAEMNSELADKIKESISSGATVIGMAAGDLDFWLRDNFAKS